MIGASAIATLPISFVGNVRIDTGWHSAEWVLVESSASDVIAVVANSNIAVVFDMVSIMAIGANSKILH